MKMIEKKIKKEEYSSLNDLKKDVQLLCRNAKTYNEDGSLIYVDAGAIEVCNPRLPRIFRLANILQNAMESRIRDEINEHPELGGDDDSSRNGGSTAPTTSNGTPAPATKLKLTFTSNSHFANGGSSGQQSDDDE